MNTSFRTAAWLTLAALALSAPAAAQNLSTSVLRPTARVRESAA